MCLLCQLVCSWCLPLGVQVIQVWGRSWGSYSAPSASWTSPSSNRTYGSELTFNPRANFRAPAAPALSHLSPVHEVFQPWWWHPQPQTSELSWWQCPGFRGTIFSFSFSRALLFSPSAYLTSLKEGNSLH